MGKKRKAPGSGSVGAGTRPAGEPAEGEAAGRPEDTGPKDKVDIGLTSAGQSSLQAIQQRGWFADGQDVARFCMSYAIKAGVALPEAFLAGVETRWSSGNFDPTGEIRAVVRALYPKCETPIRLIEYLVNEGLRLVHDRLSQSGSVGPAELLD